MGYEKTNNPTYYFLGEEISSFLPNITFNIPYAHLPNIERVIFNNPATIVYWNDGTKTIVKCQDGDVYDKEKGLLAAMAKRAYGNDNTFNKVLKKWLPEEENESKKVDFSVGDKVVFINQERHEVCPQFYPAAGTYGEILRIDYISNDVFIRWTEGTTSDDDIWWCPINSVRLIK